MKSFSHRFAACLGGLLLAGLGAGWAGAAGAGLKSDARVKVAVKTEPSAADKSETISVTLTIDKGWHIYANPAGQEDLASSQTLVTIDGKPKPETVKIDYPAGKLVKDAVIGDYKVYEDEATIKVHVRRGSESGPLTVAVKFQACNDKTCLQAATVKTTLP